MNSSKVYIALYTIVRKETFRFLRLWTQTLLPPLVTLTLYFVIFGKFIGSQVAPINGYSYMQFIVPGLIMMNILTSAFTNVVTSFFMLKFQRSLEEMLVTPMPYWVMILGFILGGVVRGLLIGVISLGVALFFTHIAIHSLIVVLAFSILTALLFSFAGLLNGLFARNFDDVSLFPTFVLTPLTYLGGVFYSIYALPPFWQMLSQFNPILYMVNGFRYGFLGISDVSVWFSFSILVVANAILAYITWRLFKRGYGLRN
jgi:ABC-2 type transport system permease protein